MHGSQAHKHPTLLDLGFGSFVHGGPPQEDTPSKQARILPRNPRVTKPYTLNPTPEIVVSMFVSIIPILLQWGDPTMVDTHFTQSAVYLSYIAGAMALSLVRTVRTRIKSYAIVIINIVAQRLQRFQSASCC